MSDYSKHWINMYSGVLLREKDYPDIDCLERAYCTPTFNPGEWIVWEIPTNNYHPYMKVEIREGKVEYYAKYFDWLNNVKVLKLPIELTPEENERVLSFLIYQTL